MKNRKKRLLLALLACVSLVFGVAYAADFFPFSGGLSTGTGGLKTLTSIEDKDAGLVILNADATYGNAFFPFGLDEAGGCGTELAPTCIESGDAGEWWELSDIYGMNHYAWGTLPEFKLNDTDGAGTALGDKHAGSLKGNFTTTTEDAEVSDVYLSAYPAAVAGTETNVGFFDGSANLWIWYGALTPSAADTYALGSATAEWSDLFLGDGAVIYGQVDSSNTLTSAATGWTAALLFTGTAGFATGADPADAGAIRLSNAEYVYAEADPADTDISVIGVDSSEVVQIAASGSSGVTITPDTTITGDLTVTGADITLAAAGVKLTGSNGSLTILGLGDGEDEDVKIDLNTTANQITVSSPASSATAVSLSALNLVTTGTILGAVNIVTTTDGSESPAAGVMYGTMFIADHATATSDTTYTLPAAAAGMAACFYDNGAGTGGITIEIDGSDVIILDGTALTAGNTIDSPGVAGDGANGDFICIMAIDATNWVTLGRSGTWVDGGAT